jgi:hypothetical protein
MSCCGKNRAMTPPMRNPNPIPPSSIPAQQLGLRFKVVLEYTGTTGLTAIGPISGLRYRFSHPGARLEVDPRDRPSLAAVPHLRQV